MAGYPLAAARQLRDDAVDAAAGALAAARDALAAAEATEQRAGDALRLHDAETARHREAAVSFSGGVADELVRAQAHLRGRARGRDALASRVADARKDRARAEDALASARAALAEARAEAKALEKHEARWHAERRAKADRRREDEADDQVAARFKPR